MRFRRPRPDLPPKPQRSTRGRMLITAGAGAGAVFAFAPFGWWPLQILSLAILFYQVLRSASPRGAALIGWAYGFGWTLAGVHWIYVSLHDFGGMAAPLAALAVAVLAVAMGLYVAMAMGGAAWLRRRRALSLPAATVLLLPACWSLAEWLRGWLFTGFPWLSAGYAHNDAPLGGYAAVLGVYGLGWLAALSAGALLLLAHRSRWRALAGVLLLLAAGQALRMVAWTQASGAPITVRLLQGNVPQDEKFNGAHVQATLQQYQDAILAAPADLIATPETAVVLLPQQLPPDYLPTLQQFVRRSGSTLVLGLPLADSRTDFYNSVIGMSAAPALYRYDKHHLVPFGEFIPLGFRWFVDLMAIPLGDMRSGASVQPAFAVRDQRVLPNICYEDLFGEEIAAQLRAPAGGQPPATMLLNVSNLAWFGDTVAIAQHLQISQMRTLETGRPMLRATNTGATAVIDGRGKVQAQLAPATRATLAATVQGMAGTTPYIAWGNQAFLALAALALAWCARPARQKAGNGAKNPGKAP